jgi:DNA-binding NarL/FixJ family response regulator
MSRPRILLADDHALLLGAFEKLLSGEFDVVGQAADGRALVAAAERLQPDVIVLDIAMPGLNGLEAGRQIKQKQKAARLIFLTMTEDPDLATEAFRIGASGYLLKRSAASELTTAIREVMQGRSYVTPLIANDLIGTLLHPAAAQTPVRTLTPRQREVLQLLAEGHPMKEIANILNISPRTVAFHKYEMMMHLKVKTTAELVQYAVRHHVV